MSDPSSAVVDIDGVVAQVDDAAGVVSALGRLPPATVLREDAMAKLFGRSRCSVKWAVQRGELPAPTRLFGQSVWTVGVVVRHLEARMAEAAREAEELARRIAGMEV
jgi:hypothetical protein